MNNHILLIIISILIVLNILSFILGFIVSKIWYFNGVYDTNKPKSFLSQSQHKDNKPESVSIDDKIYVTDIKTDGMVKKYEELGEIKKSNENISTSVDKLKKMKS